MRYRTINLGLTALAIAIMGLGASGADLHLILSSTNPKAFTKFEAAHAAIRANGTVEIVEELIQKRYSTDSNDGLSWIDTSQSHRMAVLLHGKADNEVIVLDFDSAKVVKRCSAAKLPQDFGPVDEFLLDDPVEGPLFVVKGWFRSGPPAKSVLAGLTLNPATPCEQSYRQVLRGETILNYASDGSAGVSATGSSTFLGVHLEGDRIRVPVTPDWYYSASRIPAQFLEGFDSKNGAAIQARNPTLEIVGIRNGERSKNLIHLRATGEWKLLPAGVEQKLRAFGEWIAWSEYGDLKAAAERKARTGGEVESPGSSEWRKENSRYGKGDFYGLRGNGVINTGIVHLFHAPTGRHLTIDTKQGDSEVLLVDESTVYYRVLNRMYRASITNNGISNAELLAKSDLLRDAHWAFLPKK